MSCSSYGSYHVLVFEMWEETETLVYHKLHATFEHKRSQTSWINVWLNYQMSQSKSRILSSMLVFLLSLVPIIVWVQCCTFADKCGRKPSPKSLPDKYILPPEKRPCNNELRDDLSVALRPRHRSPRSSRRWSGKVIGEIVEARKEFGLPDVLISFMQIQVCTWQIQLYYENTLRTPFQTEVWRTGWQL